MIEIAAWCERYSRLHGTSGLAPGAVESLEHDLNMALPVAFRQIASVYKGGLLGAVSVFAFDPSGPFPTIVSRTLELRSSGFVLGSDVVVAEPDGSLVVWRDAAADGPVIWLEAVDVERVIACGEPATGPVHEWPGLASFLDMLLSDDEDDCVFDPGSLAE